MCDSLVIEALVMLKYLYYIAVLMSRYRDMSLDYTRGYSLCFSLRNGSVTADTEAGLHRLVPAKHSRAVCLFKNQT